MKNASPKLDAYIAKAPAYARPILEKLRTLFHQACPDIEETMKWGVPHFEYQGIVGSMAAFKHYVGFGFWKGSLLRDPHKLFQGIGKTSMNALKLASVAELPSDQVLLEYIREAVTLNEQGVKAPATKKSAARKELKTPGRSQLGTTIGERKINASVEGAGFISQKDGAAIISFNGGKLVIEEDRVLLDDKEQGKIPADAKKIDVEFTGGTLTVTADEAKVLTLDLKK